MTKAWLALKADIDATAEEGGRVVASQMRFDAAQTLYVDAAATATDADGTEAKPFKTIQAAVDAAYRGADLIKIEIKPGTYAENVRTPTGTGSSWVFEKNGTGTVSAKSFAIDIAPYVRIEGLTLTPDAAGRAIRLVNVASAAIESNTINGNATGFGLSIFRGSARLNANRIDNAGTAIYAAEGAQVTSIGTIGEGNTVGLHAEGAIILQHADANVVATTPFKASNGGAVNVAGGASSFPSSFGQMSSLGSFTTAAALKDRLLSELAKLKAGEWRMFSFQQTISGGFGALGAGQTSHVHMQKTAGETNSYGMLTFFSHASAPVSTMRVSNGSFSDSVPIVLIDETRIATAERYGIMKAATPDVVIDEDVEDAAITPAVYHDVSDFRHKSTAYQVGDRVRCMFDMEKNLECIQAGTTAATPLNTRSVKHGQELPDGSVIWKVRTDFRSLAGNYPDASGDVTYPIATQAEAEAGEEQTKMMTALRVKQAIDQLAPVKSVNGEEPDEEGNVTVDTGGVKTVNGKEPDESGNVEIETAHNLGDTWISFDGSIPAGGVPFCGQTVTRAMYADLFDWATAQGKVKTESEWQAHAAANGGNCPYYSSGDGSTTFRMPAVVAYLKGAASASEAGTYKAEGLPNITGKVKNVSETYSSAGVCEGAFSKGSASLSHSTPDGLDAGGTGILNFDASDANQIYGKSAHVTPETYTVLVGVYAVGVISNVGSTDVSAIQTALAAVETEVNAKLPNTTAHVVESWRSGTNWYRKWSDGFIEQGGQEINPERAKVIQFNTSFTTTNIIIFLQTTDPNRTSTWTPGNGPGAPINVTKSSFVLGASSDLQGRNWIAYGY